MVTSGDGGDVVMTEGGTRGASVLFFLKLGPGYTSFTVCEDLSFILFRCAFFRM